MSTPLSPNTQVILLLTAPLIVGRSNVPANLLTQEEYKRLVRFLREKNRQPADLLGAEAQTLIDERPQWLDRDRLQHLLARGFLLSQAVEHWQARAIWVVSRADAVYPKRLKMRLKEDAPPVLYGCGETAILETGGLAVVGSRHVDEELVAYSENIGQLAACAHRTLVSGGARGIDQAAMRGALQAGGKTAGVLADSLERAALHRQHRDYLIDGQLVLISPYDPAAGFNVGHAMKRNKLIYGLADAALVVSSDYQKGGTWTGALEQLERFRFTPVYVRSDKEMNKGLEALRQKGALVWQNPTTPAALAETLVSAVSLSPSLPEQKELFSPVATGSRQISATRQPAVSINDSKFPLSVEFSPAEELFAKVRELIGKMQSAKTEAEIAADLQISKSQAKDWLQRLVEEGVIEKFTRPVRYGPKSQNSLLESSTR